MRERPPAKPGAAAFRSCTISRSIQIWEAKLAMARQKIAGILCIFQDFLTQSAAILAAKICAEAIGAASYLRYFPTRRASSTARAIFKRSGTMKGTTQAIRAAARLMGPLVLV